MKREIEIKYLLEDEVARNRLIDTLHQQFPGIKPAGSKRIISYFYESGATAEQILSVAAELFSGEDLAEVTNVIGSSQALLVKCRSIDQVNFFAVKGTPAGQDPVHAVNRLEFDRVVDIELEAVDKLLNTAGIKTASKWSSQRDYYSLNGVSKAEVEFVAGYGYKAELEIVIDDGESSDNAIASLNAMAEQLGLVEATQELLGKMYSYYNRHWQEYFNTQKVFSHQIWQQLGRP